MVFKSLLVLTLLQLLLSSEASARSSRSKTCTVASSGGSADDSEAFLKALKDCSTDSTIIFKEGIDYNIWNPVNAPKLKNVEIRVDGNLHLPKSIQDVQSIVKKGRKTWFQFTGSQVDWVGSKKADAGWIDSYGQQWYDANPPEKAGMPDRPHLLRWGVSDGSIRHFKSKKPIGWNVGISGNNNLVTGAIIDAISSTSGFPFNTDAFGVSGINITIRNSHIMNGDDALAVQNGAHKILFENNIIGYQTHGMSVGSLGGNINQAANVSDIVFNNVTVRGGLYAARFKSWKGGQGLARNVTWSNIRVHNVTFPIFVTQIYQNQANGRQERPDGHSVMMEHFTWKNFNGTINTHNPGDGSCVKPCWYNDGLNDLKHTEAIIVKCDSDRSCQNFVMSRINLTPQTKAKSTVICENVLAERNPRLGFKCQNGLLNSV